MQNKKIIKFSFILIPFMVIFSVLLFPISGILKAIVVCLCLLGFILSLTWSFFAAEISLLFFKKEKIEPLAFNENNLKNLMLEKLTRTHKIRPMLFSIAAILKNNLDVKSVSVFVADRDFSRFVMKESLNNKIELKKQIIFFDNPMVAELLEKKELIDVFSLENSAIVDEIKKYNSSYVVPVVHSQEVVAFILLSVHNDGNPLDQAKVMFLDNIRVFLGNPIHNTISFYDSVKKVEEMSSLYEVSKVISSSFEMDKTLSLIANNASILLKASKVILIIKESIDSPFRLKIVKGLPGEVKESLEDPDNFKKLLLVLSQIEGPLVLSQEDKEHIGMDCGSAIVIPVFDVEMLIKGYLFVARSKDQAIFTNRELALASNLSNNIGIAIKNSSLYGELNTAYHIAKELNATHDFVKLQDKILAVLRREFDFERILIFILDPLKEELHASRGYGWDEKFFESLSVSIQESVLGRSIVENRDIFIKNAEVDPRTSSKIVSFLSLKSFISIPLASSGRVVGTLIADYGGKEFEGNLLNKTLLDNVASISSMALSNTLLLHETNSLNKSLRKEQSKTEKELKIARRIQQGILSRQTPDIKDVSIATRNIPCRAVGGDFYNFKLLGKKKMSFSIGDVSGKGVPAALIMTMASEIFNEVTARDLSPKEALVEINSMLSESLTGIPLFYATAFHGVFDFNKNLFTYCKAGHNPPVMFRKKENKSILLDAEGSYLGAFDDPGFIEKTIKLERGDKLLFYTDGLTECKNEYKKMFGTKALMKLVEKYSALEPDKMIEAILDEVTEFIGNKEFSDDLILVVCEINSSFKRMSSKVHKLDFEIPSDKSQTKFVVSEILESAEPYIVNREHIFHLRLAISEAILNAIEHGNHNDKEKKIRIHVEIHPYMIQVNIEDDGDGFKMEAISIPENSDDTFGRGRGMLAINACMDEINYSDEGNVLTLIKYFNG